MQFKPKLENEDSMKINAREVVQSTPLVSIIIPALNEEKLLTQLLQQLYDTKLRNSFNYEIILSDGGSIDNTIMIAQQKKVKIVQYHSIVRQTIAGGRNLGSSIASGDIFLFLNADVLMEDSYALLKWVTTDFYFSQYLAATCKVLPFKDEIILSDKLFHGFYNSYFKFLNSIGMGMGRGECQIIKREVFLKVGGYNSNLTAGEDFELFGRIIKLGRIFFNTKILVRESPRRYRRYGYWKITFEWFKNSSSIVFTNKSVSKEWEAVR